MIIRFICWFWGHKTVMKVVTGQKLTVNGSEEALYKLERQVYCVRCGRGNS